MLSLLCVFTYASGQQSLKYAILSSGFNNSKGIHNICLNPDSVKKPSSGFYLGANVGMYFANRNTAQYYNGAGVNGVDSVINHSYNYPQIRERLNYDFKLAELPAKMRYSPSLLFGLNARYSIKNFGIFANFNITKLKTKDIFTIEILDPGNTLSQKIYKQESISGSEQRAIIDFGFNYIFKSKGIAKPYIEAGININDTKFLDNKISIEGLDFSIVNYYYSYHQLEQGGIGMGAFAGFGLDMTFSEYITIDPGINLYYTKIKLGDIDEYKLNSTFYFRIILNGLL